MDRGTIGSADSLGSTGWNTQTNAPIKTTISGGKEYYFLDQEGLSRLGSSGKTAATIKLVAALIKTKRTFSEYTAIQSTLKEVRGKAIASLGFFARLFGGKGRVEKKFEVLFTELETHLSKTLSQPSTELPPSPQKPPHDSPKPPPADPTISAPWPSDAQEDDVVPTLVAADLNREGSSSHRLGQGSAIPFAVSPQVAKGGAPVVPPHADPTIRSEPAFVPASPMVSPSAGVELPSDFSPPAPLPPMHQNDAVVDPSGIPISSQTAVTPSSDSLHLEEDSLPSAGKKDALAAFTVRDGEEEGASPPEVEQESSTPSAVSQLVEPQVNVASPPAPPAMQEPEADFVPPLPTRSPQVEVLASPLEQSAPSDQKSEDALANPVETGTGVPQISPEELAIPSTASQQVEQQAKLDKLSESLVSQNPVSVDGKRLLEEFRAKLTELRTSLASGQTALAEDQLAVLAQAPAKIQGADDLAKAEARTALKTHEPKLGEGEGVRREVQRSIDSNPDILAGLGKLDRIRQGYATLESYRKSVLPDARSPLGRASIQSCQGFLSGQLDELKRALDQGQEVSFADYETSRDSIALLLAEVDTQGESISTLLRDVPAQERNSKTEGVYGDFNRAVDEVNTGRQDLQAEQTKPYTLKEDLSRIKEKIKVFQAKREELTRLSGQIETLHSQDQILNQTEQLQASYTPFSLAGQAFASEGQASLDGQVREFRNTLNQGRPLTSEQLAGLSSSAGKFLREVREKDEAAKKACLGQLAAKVQRYEGSVLPKGVRRLHDQIEASIRETKEGENLADRVNMSALDTMIQKYEELSGREKAPLVGTPGTLRQKAVAALQPELTTLLSQVLATLDQGAVDSFAAYDEKKAEIESFLEQVSREEDLIQELCSGVVNEPKELSLGLYGQYNEAVRKEKQLRAALQDATFSPTNFHDELISIEQKAGDLRACQATITDISVKLELMEAQNKALVNARELMRNFKCFSAKGRDMIDQYAPHFKALCDEFEGVLGRGTPFEDEEEYLTADLQDFFEEVKAADAEAKAACLRALEEKVPHLETAQTGVRVVYDQVKKSIEEPQEGDVYETNPNMALLDEVISGYKELDTLKELSIQPNSNLGKVMVAKCKQSLTAERDNLKGKLNEGKAVSFDNYHEWLNKGQEILGLWDIQGTRVEELRKVTYQEMPSMGYLHEEFNTAVVRERTLRASLEEQISSEISLDDIDAITAQVTELEECHKTIADISNVMQDRNQQTAKRLMGFYQPFSGEGKAYANKHGPALEQSISAQNVDGEKLLNEIRAFNTAVKAADEEARASSLAALERMVSVPIVDEGVRLVYDRVKTSIKDNNLDVENDMALLGQVIQGYKDLAAQKAGMPEGKTHTGISAAAAWNPILQAELVKLESQLKMGESVSFDSYNKKKEEVQALLFQVNLQEAIVRDLFKVTIEERPGESALHTAYKQAYEEEAQISKSLKAPTFSQDPSADVERIKADVEALKAKQAQIQLLTQQLENRERFQKSLEFARPILEAAHSRLSNLRECADVCDVPCDDFLKTFREDFTRASELLNTALFETGSFEVDIRKLEEHGKAVPLIIQQAEEAVKDKIRKALAPNDDWKEFGEFAATLLPDQLSSVSRIALSLVPDSKSRAEDLESSFTLNPESVRALKAAGDLYHASLMALRKDPEVAFAFVKDNLRKVRGQITALSTQIDALEAKKQAPVAAAASDQGFWAQDSAAIATDQLQPQIDELIEKKKGLLKIDQKLSCFIEMVVTEKSYREQLGVFAHVLTAYEKSLKFFENNPSGIAQLREIKGRIEEFIRVGEAMEKEICRSEGNPANLQALFSSEDYRQFNDSYNSFSNLALDYGKFLRGITITPAEKARMQVIAPVGEGHPYTGAASALNSPISRGTRYPLLLKTMIEQAMKGPERASELETLFDTRAFLRKKLAEAEAMKKPEPADENSFRLKVLDAIERKRKSELESIKANPRVAFSEAQTMLKEGIEKLHKLAEAGQALNPMYAVDPKIEEGLLATLRDLEAKFEDPSQLDSLASGILDVPKMVKAAVHSLFIESSESSQFYDVARKLPEVGVSLSALKSTFEIAVSDFNNGVGSAEACMKAKKAYEDTLAEVRATPDGTFLLFQNELKSLNEEIIALRNEEEAQLAALVSPFTKENPSLEVLETRRQIAAKSQLIKNMSPFGECVETEANFRSRLSDLTAAIEVLRPFVEQRKKAAILSTDFYRGVLDMFLEVDREIAQIKEAQLPVLHMLEMSEGNPEKLHHLFLSPEFKAYANLLCDFVSKTGVRNSLLREVNTRAKKDDILQYDDYFTAYENAFIQPAQRMPRYDLLLKEVAKRVTDRDLTLINSARERVKDIVDVLNDSQRSEEERDGLLSIDTEGMTASEINELTPEQRADRITKRKAAIAASKARLAG